MQGRQGTTSAAHTTCNSATYSASRRLNFTRKPVRQLGSCNSKPGEVHKGPELGYTTNRSPNIVHSLLHRTLSSRVDDCCLGPPLHVPCTGVIHSCAPTVAV